MKKQIILLTLFLTLTNIAFSQIDFYLTDLNTKKKIHFNQIFSELNINKELPTLVITWSDRLCVSCLDLINIYYECDLSMINLITINVDNNLKLDDVIDKGYHLKWDKSFNFYGNVGNGNYGLDEIFNVTKPPLVLYLDNGKITDAIQNAIVLPYKLVKFGRIKDIKFIWNSSRNLNGLAWESYKNETSKDKLEEAKKWIIRSIELNKDYYNVDTYAALLFKTGFYTQALKRAKEAIEIAKKNNIDYKSTSDLINLIIEKL
jgi:tetratricopeptide (TPR) repeat protein